MRRTFESVRLLLDRLLDHGPEALAHGQAQIARGHLIGQENALAVETRLGEEVLLVLAYALDRVVGVAFACDHGKIAQRLHRKQPALENLLHAVRIELIVLGQIEFGQHEYGPLAVRVHFAHQVGHVAALRINRAVFIKI